MQIFLRPLLHECIHISRYITALHRDTLTIACRMQYALSNKTDYQKNAVGVLVPSREDSPTGNQRSIIKRICEIERPKVKQRAVKDCETIVYQQRLTPQRMDTFISAVCAISLI